MKKILVFTYPFDRVERIVDYAVRLARDVGLPLEFIHVVEEPQIPAVDPVATDFTTTGIAANKLSKDFVENRSRMLEKVLSIKKASMEFPVSYSFKVVPGSIEALIADIENRHDIEMVLVPNSDEVGSGHPVAELVEGVNKPVFAFPLDEEYRGFHNIVYATDFNEADLPVLKRTARFARRFMASITVLHVNKQKKYEESLKVEGFQKKLKNTQELRNIVVAESKSDKIVKGIKDFSRRNYADLVVLLHENRNFWQEIFGSSTTKDLVKNSSVPLLIYHEK